MEDCPSDANISLPSLNLLQVTGRVATHVHDFAYPACVLHPCAARAVQSMRKEASEAGI